MSEELTYEVVRVVVDTLQLQGRALDATSELLEGIPELDSLAILEVVARLEDRFGFAFEDEDVNGDVFATIGSLSEHIARSVQ